MSGRLGAARFEPLSFNANQDSDAFFDDDSDWDDDGLDNLLDGADLDDYAYGGQDTNDKGQRQSLEISMPSYHQQLAYDNRKRYLFVFAVFLIITALAIHPTAHNKEISNFMNGTNATSLSDDTDRPELLPSVSVSEPTASPSKVLSTSEISTPSMPSPPENSTDAETSNSKNFTNLTDSIASHEKIAEVSNSSDSVPSSSPTKN